MLVVPKRTNRFGYRRNIVGEPIVTLNSSQSGPFPELLLNKVGNVDHIILRFRIVNRPVSRFTLIIQKIADQLTITVTYVTKTFRLLKVSTYVY